MIFLLYFILFVLFCVAVLFHGAWHFITGGTPGISVTERLLYVLAYRAPWLFLLSNNLERAQTFRLEHLRLHNRF